MIFSNTDPGPVNFRDLHLKLILPLAHGIEVTLDWLSFWRERLTDGIYAVPGTLLVPADTSRARYVGQRPGVEARWQIDRHAYMQASYGVFYAGPFLKQSGHPQNLNYLNHWLGYKF